MNNQLVVVCGPGVDDMLALMVMVGLGQPPRAVIGTAGNGDVDMGFRNAAGIVASLGLDVPVGRGSSTALVGPYPDASPFYGPDGLGGIADALPPVGDPHPDPMSLVTGTVLAIGPLTVVAEALRAGCAVSDVVWMGGSLAAGNMSAVAEFNAWLDPQAADLVLSSGIEVALIPLDVTTKVALIAPDLDRMAQLGQFAELAARSCAYISQRDNEIIPHDAVAAVAMVCPHFFGWEERRWARCETTGTHTCGMTVVDRRPDAQAGNVRVATSVDASGVKERIFESLRALG